MSKDEIIDLIEQLNCLFEYTRSLDPSKVSYRFRLNPIDGEFDWEIISPDQS